MRPDYIIIHHSLTEDGKVVNWQAIRDYHVNVQKFREIGYHYGLEKIGDRYEILKGRLDTECGDHCIGFNERSIGICLIGNFDATPPSADALAKLKAIINSLRQIYDIDSSCVLGHWETYQMRNVPIEKSCPGNLFSMRRFREFLNEANPKDNRVVS